MKSSFAVPRQNIFEMEAEEMAFESQTVRLAVWSTPKYF
jgi:hypothetical protein